MTMLICFDLDGTLLDHSGAGCRACRLAQRLVGP